MTLLDPVRELQALFGEPDDVGPQGGLFHRFELGQIEIGARPGSARGRGVVDEVQNEIDEGAGERFAADLEVALVEMKPARAHDQHRGPIAQCIMLAADRIGEIKCAAPAVDEIGLAIDQVRPGRGRRILEVGHERPRARIQRVDDHLGGRRTGDLDPAIAKVAGCRRDLPVRIADNGGVGAEVRKLLRVVAGLPLDALGKQGPPPRVEPAMHVAKQDQRLGGQDLVASRMPAERGFDCRRVDQDLVHTCPSSAIT